MSVSQSGRTRVVIVGGGHAGFHAAKRLNALRMPSDNIDLILVSSETSEVYHGLMPQIVGGKVQARNVQVPLRNYLPGVTFYHYDVERIDIENRTVYLDPVAERATIKISYDFLVVALGSVPDLSRFPGLLEHGLQTKTIGDVYNLHDHLLEMLERASVEQDAAERQRLLTFVIVGAGYAGIEIGAETNNLLRAAVRFYPTLRSEELRVSIVSNTDRILPAMREKLAWKAAQYLSKKGVRLRLNTSVVSANAGELLLSDGERLQTRSVIVTAGIAPNPVVMRLPVEQDRGRVKTDQFCRVPDAAGVYAVGDNAWVPHSETGDACPATFLYAVTQGARAAENIIAEMRGRPLRAYTFHSFTEVAQLGITFGLVQIGGIAFSGLFASLLVRTVFFFYIPSWRCRLGLLADWLSEVALPPDLSQMKVARTNVIVPLRFSAGQEIIRQGEPGTRFYIINSGKVEVVRGSGAQEQVLAVLGPGQYFGEIALLNGSDRTATVRAVEDTTVLGIARKDFTALVRSLPVLERAMSAVTRNSVSFAAQGEPRNTV